MSSLGFQLVRLALTGPRVDDAEVGFNSGLNVVIGPSDTGKTFILQCIDFILGAKDPPEEVPEAAPYDTVVLDLKINSSGEIFTLHRSLQGGGITLRVPGEDDRTLGEKHVAGREDTLSHILLELTGLAGMQVRKNARNETRSLSFRDLAHLSIVSEEDVIRTVSPVLTGQHISATAEKSVFRLMLSGNDDNSLVSSEEPRISRIRTEAKIEVLQGLIERTRARATTEVETTSNLPSLRGQLARLDATYEEASAELATLEESVTSIEQSRRQTLMRYRRIESRLDVLSGLKERFVLLGEQYVSDLRRLEAIAEAGGRLTEMGVERCPVCGALAEHHDEEHQDLQTDPTAVAEGCNAEALRIKTLISDLEITQGDVNCEASDLEAEKQMNETALEAMDLEIQERLKPRIQEILQRIKSNREKSEDIRNAIAHFERIEELEELVTEFSDAPPSVSIAHQGREIGAAEIEAFCAEVDARLRAWNFPGLDRVTFSEINWDIVISGRRRTSHGKGVRAVTHAAFTLALFQYCVSRQLPHPGFVAIDSPLVVYREPDPEENGFSRDVKASFFRDIAATFTEEQVILLENEEPPQELSTSPQVNVIRFTGTNVGRKGFFPTLTGSVRV